MAFGQYLGYVGMVAGAVVGGVIGSIFPGIGTVSGAAFGASLGGMIGGIAGQVFFPELADLNLPPPPQPHEARAQVSTYGAPIPIVYESARLAGNIIYMQDINQDVTRTSHRQDGVRYYEITSTYASTFAIAFCEGPVTGISRIWVNHKIFADFRDPAGEYYPTGSVALAAANLATSVARNAVYFTTYLGTESQTADPTLVSLLTDAETPAYRGICYIVFIDFPVGEFSGLPLIEVEIGEVMSANACTHTFDGTGAGLDADFWYGAPEVWNRTDGEATLIMDNAPGWERTGSVYTYFEFTAIFDVQIDWTLENVHSDGPLAPNGGYFNFFATEYDAGFAGIIWGDQNGEDPGGVAYQIIDPNTSAYVYVQTADRSGKLRITRDGSGTTKFFYWNSTLSRWEWDGDTDGVVIATGSSSVTSIYLEAYIQSYNGEADTSILTIDNFITNDGCDNAEFPT